jgi:hypothetical protein
MQVNCVVVSILENEVRMKFILKSLPFAGRQARRATRAQNSFKARLAQTFEIPKRILPFCSSKAQFFYMLYSDII